MTSILKVMICWTSPCRAHRRDRVGMVELVPWPDHPGGRSHQLVSAAGACDARVRKLNARQREYYVMSTALGLIMRDGMDPKVVHAALWPLKEYRDGLPSDTTPPQCAKRALCEVS